MTTGRPTDSLSLFSFQSSKCPLISTPLLFHLAPQPRRLDNFKKKKSPRLNTSTSLTSSQTMPPKWDAFGSLCKPDIMMKVQNLPLKKSAILSVIPFPHDMNNILTLPHLPNNSINQINIKASIFRSNTMKPLQTKFCSMLKPKKPFIFPSIIQGLSGISTILTPNTSTPL